tara:strand:+ start:2393 stop:2614 length:222 start_codon:yes stop_codon:yes gene_type:complete
MLDWFYRLIGYKLDKDLIKKHQLEQARLWVIKQNFKAPIDETTQLVVKEKSQKQKHQLKSYKDAVKSKTEIIM